MAAARSSVMAVAIRHERLATALSKPAEVNGATRAMLQFAGCTVDGESSAPYLRLLQSDVRY
jgi:hypothetical protein